MQGASRESFSGGRDRLEALLSAGGTDPASVGEDLFAVTGLLADNAGVRRALADPSREGEAKAGLVARLLGGHVQQDVIDLVAGLVRGRWARGTDLTDSVERLAVSSVLAGADRNGRLDAVEDELFRFSRIIGADQGLRDALSVRSEGLERKAELVRRLLSGQAAPETVRLAVQAAVRPRGLRTEQVLEGYVEAAAERRQQLVAHVVAAVPLTAEQRSRLVSALSRQYGRPIRLNVDLDPSVIGGLRVQVGGELQDGSVNTRLEDARRRMAG